MRTFVSSEFIDVFAPLLIESCPLLRDDFASRNSRLFVRSILHLSRYAAGFFHLGRVRCPVKCDTGIMRRKASNERKEQWVSPVQRFQFCRRRQPRGHNYLTSIQRTPGDHSDIRLDRQALRFRKVGRRAKSGVGFWKVCRIHLSIPCLHFVDSLGAYHCSLIPQVFDILHRLIFSQCSRTFNQDFYRNQAAGEECLPRFCFLLRIKLSVFRRVAGIPIFDP